MKLFFEEITGKARQYIISDGCWLPREDRAFLLNATAVISVSRRDDETAVLKGEIQGLRAAVCDRCGERVDEKLHCEFFYMVTTRKEQALELHDLECSDEDANTLYLEEMEIDVDEILREQSYLAVPLKTLCRADCKGVCAGCGVALNREACCCVADTSSSAFAVLKKLNNS
jgi:DUF177 domain-containing protein